MTIDKTSWKNWSRGDRLTVVAFNSGFCIGDVVIYDDDIIGSPGPWVVSEDGTARSVVMAMNMKFLSVCNELTTQLKYEEWKKGDKLLVISVDSNDPFKVGDVVIHRDKDGDPNPFVSKGSNGYTWALRNDQLQFVSRGVDDEQIIVAYGEEIGIPSLTVEELIESHRRIRNQNIAQSVPKCAPDESTVGTHIKVSDLRKMTIDEIAKLIG